MIRFIAAIDSKKGLADEHGIPWDLPTEKKYFRDKTESGLIIMGYGTYLEFNKPMHGRTNYVATTSKDALKPGFIKVADARSFLQSQTEDVWNIGGAGLFSTTLDLADELYLTHIDGDFHCTKFFPDFEKGFELVEKSSPQTDKGINFFYAIYKRKGSI